MFTNIIIPIVCACIYGALKVMEIEEERKRNECEQTDWNAYYANI